MDLLPNYVFIWEAEWVDRNERKLVLVETGWETHFITLSTFTG